MDSWYVVIRNIDDRLEVRLDSVSQRHIEEISEKIDLCDFDKITLSDHGEWSNFKLLITRVIEAALKLGLRKNLLDFKIQEKIFRKSPDSETKECKWTVSIYSSDQVTFKSFNPSVRSKETVVLNTNYISYPTGSNDSEKVELLEFADLLIRGYELGHDMFIIQKAAQATFRLSEKISSRWPKQTIEGSSQDLELNQVPV